MVTLRNKPGLNLKGCYIAGGAILSVATKTEINDYDVYPKDKQSMIDAFYELLEDNCFVVNITDRAVSFISNDMIKKNGERTVIQVMTYDTFETPEKIFANFDFTVCMGAYDCDTCSYTFHDDFFPDIASRNIRFNVGTRYPLNSILRISKYIAKGFYISKPEMIKMCLTVIKNGAPTSWDELETQIGGAYGREIKLKVKENEEYSFERAVEILSTIENLDSYIDLTENFSHFTGDDLEEMFSDEIDVVKNCEGVYFSIRNGMPSKSFGPTRQDNFNVLNEDENGNLVEYILKGKKIVREPDPEGYMKSNIFSSKSTRYKVGEITEELSHPHIFVFHDESKQLYVSKGTNLIDISYDASDLMKVKRDIEFNVRKLKVESIVAKGS